MTKDSGASPLRMQLFGYLGKYGTLMVLGLMILFFSVLLPPFRSPENMINLLGQFALLAIFSAGQTCVLKMLDFDLSIGAIAAITGIVVGTLLVEDYSVTTAICFGLLTGIICGMVNGFLVAYVELNALIATLATMSIIAGAAMAITKGLSIWNLPANFSYIGRGDFLGIPVRFFIMIVLITILALFHSFTPSGRRMEAIGGNAEASRMSGINVRFNRFLGFVLSGVCGAVGGIVLTSNVMTATAAQGMGYGLDSLAACFIGAATVRVGQFHIWGTLAGVMLVAIAINGLIIMMVPGYYTTMIQGGILLLAVFMTSVGFRGLKK
jgi:ribose transport system permease protein